MIHPSVTKNHTILTEDDVGKRVLSGCGDEVGRVVGFEGGSAQVSPNPDGVDPGKTALAGDDQSTKDTYRLNDEQVDAVTDEEIRLRS